MRRYIGRCDRDQIEKVCYDVVIIGSGLAGLYTALNIDDRLSCAILSKESEDDCNSYLAQGGIAAVMGKDDKIELHYEDTLSAGVHLCDQEAVKVLVNNAPQEINRLMSMGVDFDVDKDGNLHITREGGHSHNRIVHCGGDATGREVVKKLTELVKSRPNITLKRNVFLLDIITHQGRAAGVLVYEGKHKLYVSQNIVICSGGIGQVYKYTTNPLGTTGDGIAAAIRAGAEVKDMEFVQFHPTALYHENTDERFFLISEAVRGEGGILRNQKGEHFMLGRHPMADLAPRDIVARQIHSEIESSGIPYVYLDITFKSKEFLIERFPTIYQECKRYGIDISKQYIPVRPVQHYFMGGIKTDLNAMSNILGLYAVGESACTGVHGANRLASNSLLECLVFGRRCSLHINQGWQNNHAFDSGIEDNFINDYCFVEDEENVCLSEGYFQQMKMKIKGTMVNHGGIIRNRQGLEQGLETISAILRELQNIHLSTRLEFEVYNMALIAQQVLKAALDRKKSIGAHYRSDDEN